MRVVTGKARGKKLITLEGRDVRPTTDMVKESVFSIIQFQVQGRRFLDMFAGSGQMGIEALSRGAKEAYFLDMRREAVSVIKKNLESTELSQDAKIMPVDSLSFVKTTGETFDIAFLDPPYGQGLCHKALEILPRVMNRGGVIICETEKEESLPERAGDFLLDRTYRYGKIKITTYRLPEEE